MEKLYLIAWKSKTTGYEGRGEKPIPEKLAYEWIKYLSEKHPDMNHWLVELKD